MNILISLLVNGLIVLVLAMILPGIHVSGFGMRWTGSLLIMSDCGYS